ncbi:putative disease resistance protein RGA1 [Mangifera indica]|uniref:putative disease resistance protein RGA1 n=1 Tax=Mangifera indica TaxID=29780 RepID=UPI001CFA0080|nr:putative disease resistance protein RGA1 [Mangifera indica]
MAEAIVSFALKQLGSILSEQASGYIRKQVSLVGDVDEEVDKLTNNLRAIQAVLFDAEQKQMKEEAVRVWLHRLKDVCYEVEDVLDEWNTAILKLQIERGQDHNALGPKKKVSCFFPSPCFGFKEVVLRRDIAVKITDINKKLDVIAKEKSDYNLNVIMAIERPDNQQMQTTSFIDVPDIIGRDNLKKDLVSKLLCEGSEQNLHIISLVGMGGIGKTTLAQFAYLNNEVENNFDKRIWVCVSKPFDEIRIAKAIYQSLKNQTPNATELEYLLQCIHDSVKSKKILLILDDVWTDIDKKWEPFYNCLKNGHCGSKILITTRNKLVARMINSIDIVNVGELPYEENWSLFEKLAFFQRPPNDYENLEEIGREIVRKCKGLPLATITIGSLLRFKESKEQWQHVLDSELWKLENVEKDLLTPLMLSYNDLPPMVKQCFIYCSIFPKDYEYMYKDRLIDFWMAQGYLGLEKNGENEEIIGKEYCDYLLTRSLLQENESWSYKMHDIVHDFAQFLGNNECLSVEVHGVEDLITNSSHDKVRHLKLTLDGVGASFLESTFRLKWLHRNCLIETLPQGIEKLVNLRRLQFETFDHALLYMPKGVEKLTGLRRLSEFVISGGGDHDNKACSFEGLKNLNRLEGSLTVRGLGNLTDVSDGKLTNVFKSKEKLHQLKLEFCKREEQARLGEDDELILNTLQLPPNLENLSIYRYRGNTVPSTNWMTLTKLKELTLERCSNCKHLHHLGNLPFLKMLWLIEMSNVKKVDNDFWGIESETSSSSSLCVHFPKLTEFSFWDTREWEEWDCKVEEFMPCLASLTIVRCPKLKALPDRLLQRTTLKQLHFSESPILTERYNKETGEDWPKISHIPYIEIDCKPVQHE